MRIQLINPNTTASMTQKMCAAAQSVAHQGTIILGYTPAHGPVSIEGYFDEAVAAVGVCEAIMDAREHAFDGHIIACFGDPALLAARELSRVPVIGIAQAAFHYASLISERFVVVTSLARTIPLAKHLLKSYGFEQQCAGVTACELSVLDIEQCTGVPEVMRDACLDAIQKNSADALVLGCGGMADWVKELESVLGIPVVEGVCAATVMLESLHAMGLKSAKNGHLAYPLSKQFDGRFAQWSNVSL